MVLLWFSCDRGSWIHLNFLFVSFFFSYSTNYDNDKLYDDDDNDSSNDNHNNDNDDGNCKVFIKRNNMSRQ